MYVLVLGGNGYLGSKVTRKIVEAGHSVVCTKRSNSNLSRLADIEKHIKWIPATIESVVASMQYNKFDYVLNMACNYGKSNILYDSVIEANIEFPLKVLNAAVGNGTKHYITIGTGLPDNLNMYSFSKKMLGDFGKFYVNKHGIDFNNLLLEMFYGADEPETRFIPSVITKMIAGKPVYTTIGTQQRDIISVNDIVDAVLIVFNNTPKGYNEISVGTGIAPTISEIIDFIWEKTGKKSKVYKGEVPMRKDEPNCVADISFMKSLGHWQPVNWKTGLAQMITEIKEQKEDNQ